MANLGTRMIVALTDVGPYPAGAIVAADCWLNLDRYEDCAEAPHPLDPKADKILFGRITDGRWKYANPDHCPHKANEWNADGTVLTCTHCGLDVT